MNILVQFISRVEQNSAKVIGQVDCSFNTVNNVLVNMLSSIGMSNPTGVKTSSSKAVKVVKKGKVYTLTLYMFNPPVVIKWTGAISYDKLIDIIEDVQTQKKSIAYMNTININQEKFFQFALAD